MPAPEQQVQLEQPPPALAQQEEQEEVRGQEEHGDGEQPQHTQQEQQEQQAPQQAQLREVALSDLQLPSPPATVLASADEVQSAGPGRMAQPQPHPHIGASTGTGLPGDAWTSANVGGAARTPLATTWQQHGPTASTSAGSRAASPAGAGVATGAVPDGWQHSVLAQWRQLAQQQGRSWAGQVEPASTDWLADAGGLLKLLLSVAEMEIRSCLLPPASAAKAAQRRRRLVPAQVLNWPRPQKPQLRERRALPHAAAEAAAAGQQPAGEAAATQRTPPQGPAQAAASAEGQPEPESMIGLPGGAPAVAGGSGGSDSGSQQKHCSTPGCTGRPAQECGKCIGCCHGDCGSYSHRQRAKELLEQRQQKQHQALQARQQPAAQVQAPMAASSAHAPMLAAPPALYLLPFQLPPQLQGEQPGAPQYMLLQQQQLPLLQQAQQLTLLPLQHAVPQAGVGLHGIHGGAGFLLPSPFFFQQPPAPMMPTASAPAQVGAHIASMLPCVILSPAFMALLLTVWPACTGPHSTAAAAAGAGWSGGAHRSRPVRARLALHLDGAHWIQRRQQQQDSGT